MSSTTPAPDESDLSDTPNVVVTGVTESLGLPPVSWETLSLGAGAFVAAVILGYAARYVAKAYLRWRGAGPSAVDVFSKLVQWGILLLGFLTAMTLIFPSVQPVDILGGVGVISIAAGIAFQTVLGNMFAGIVILARGSYTVGDQIAVRDVRGEVTDISLNSTTVRTFDGRQVLVPNQVMHSDVVTVQTGYEAVRTSVTVQVDAEADPARTQRIAVEAMSDLPEVLATPQPQALLTELNKGALTVEMRFWSGARQFETREAQHAVIAAVLAAFNDNAVMLADEVQVIEAGPQLLKGLENRDTHQR
ncbi:mechanosensitive ion channel family protein [Ornithinimicrobium sp. INDO-MA30-4]|uniref:mechanosensitive ion channel family protein n=1 Tax=Ornithinimicrobium sp. INDO-MA30-4 TaxID=2908651 RepID=UPI001F1E384F|nr:mechanosensitive ion channel family protein [Ornithinimicrobium sp. INDO-MA30-4]UJH69913.1 mechanosensitive ion channel family protein [Ornithinimicrobium sp. INDO-MA30-4]